MFIQISRKDFLKNVISLTTTHSAILIINSSIPIILNQYYKRNASEISIIFIITLFGYMLGNILSGKLLSLGHYEKTIKFCLVNSILCSFFIAYSFQELTLQQLSILLLLLNIFMGVIYPTYHGTILSQVATYRGTASSLYGFIQLSVSASFVSLMLIKTGSDGTLIFSCAGLLLLLNISYNYLSIIISKVQGKIAKKGN